MTFNQKSEKWLFEIWMDKWSFDHFSSKNTCLDLKYLRFHWFCEWNCNSVVEQFGVGIGYQNSRFCNNFQKNNADGWPLGTEYTLLFCTLLFINEIFISNRLQMPATRHPIVSIQTSQTWKSQILNMFISCWPRLDVDFISMHSFCYYNEIRPFYVYNVYTIYVMGMVATIHHLAIENWINEQTKKWIDDGKSL